MIATVSPEEAAEELGITRHEVFRLIEQRKLRTARRPGDFLEVKRIVAADVAALKRQRAEKAGDEIWGDAVRLNALDAELADGERWLATYRSKMTPEEIAQAERELEEKKARRDEFAAPARRRAPLSPEVAAMTMDELDAELATYGYRFGRFRKAKARA